MFNLILNLVMNEHVTVIARLNKASGLVGVHPLLLFNTCFSSAFDPSLMQIVQDFTVNHFSSHTVAKLYPFSIFLVLFGIDVSSGIILATYF